MLDRYSLGTYTTPPSIMYHVNYEESGPHCYSQGWNFDIHRISGYYVALYELTQGKFEKPVFICEPSIKDLERALVVHLKADEVNFI